MGLEVWSVIDGWIDWVFGVEIFCMNGYSRLTLGVGRDCCFGVGSGFRVGFGLRLG